MQVLNKLSNIFASPVLLGFTLPILMVYLIVGTVAQKYIGLYEATRIFFTDPVVWWGFVPIPGSTTIIALIFLNLVFKLFVKSPWSLKNAGNIITHFGALLLLLGGLLTMVTASESYVDIPVGGHKSYSSDYHIREFAILDADQSDVFVIDHLEFAEKGKLDLPDLGLEIEIVETCRNCMIERREDKDETFVGMAQHMRLIPTDLFNENEENLAGMTFRATDKQDNQITGLVLENVPAYPILETSEKTYTFQMRRKKRDLPFTVELLSFEKDTHPGTTMAKSYQSRVRIHDGDAKWESLIRMNEPLRYKGYTLYQASYIRSEDGYVSVLSAVKNAGRIFPYISGITICIGILVHLFVRRRFRKNKQNKAA